MAFMGGALEGVAKGPDEGKGASARLSTNAGMGVPVNDEIGGCSLTQANDGWSCVVHCTALRCSSWCAAVRDGQTALVH